MSLKHYGKVSCNLNSFSFYFIYLHVLHPFSTNLKKCPPTLYKTGTHDWHIGRKFSLTSSQAHGGVVTAFPLFQEKQAWINKVVSYMFGEENWRDELGVSLELGPDAAGAAADGVLLQPIQLPLVTRIPTILTMNMPPLIP